MTDFTDAYRDLLVIPYHSKPNARAEIELYAGIFERIKDAAKDFPNAYDLDNAVGAQLTIIGKIVGLLRTADPSFSDDDTYRFYVRVKIAKNNVDTVLKSDDRLSLQDVIRFAFEDEAYVIDNKDMTLTLYTTENVDTANLQLLFDLDLLPSGQGVQYKDIVQAADTDFFGFAINPNSKPFDDKFDSAFDGGTFADKVIL